MSKLYLCGITNAGNEANLRALIEPVAEYFHGLQWGFSYPTDAGSEYLESMKGDGRIAYYHWSNRHGAAMTQYLHQGTMVPGDFFLTVDTMERLGAGFCANRLPGLIQLMDEAELDVIANHGKGLIYRYTETLEFQGSPHWYAVGHNGRAINLELDKGEFWNVRDEQRAPFQWVDHYARYMVSYPAGSNHALLGLDTYGDPAALFPPREAKRLAFRKELVSRGYPLTLDGLKAALSVQPLDPVLKDYLNTEKVWSDYYHYHILGDTTVIHSHLPSDIKLLP